MPAIAPMIIAGATIRFNIKELLFINPRLALNGTLNQFKRKKYHALVPINSFLEVALQADRLP